MVSGVPPKVGRFGPYWWLHADFTLDGFGAFDQAPFCIADSCILRLKLKRNPASPFMKDAGFYFPLILRLVTLAGLEPATSPAPARTRTLYPP